MPLENRPNCDKCPYHVNLVEDLSEIKADTKIIRETQANRNSLCAERGNEIGNQKETIKELKTEDTKIWAVISVIERNMNRGIGIIISVTVVLQLVQLLLTFWKLRL